MSTPIFTLPFPEYDIANILERNFTKKKNFSVSIPLSRQQKFYDLLLINGKKKRVLTIQIKSSRTFLFHSSKKRKNENIFDKYEYNGFFPYFDIKNNYSDYYFFHMLYPIHDKNFRPRARWGRRILVFNKGEMVTILKKVKTKKGKQGKFFWFLLNSLNKKIGFYGGYIEKENMYQENLLENKLKEMKRKINLPFS